MSLHDCYIHGIGFNFEKYQIFFDIDYILKWHDPEANSSYFSFDISPATMVFNNINELYIDIAPMEEVQIDNLSRSRGRTPRNSSYIDKETEWNWLIECDEGNISFYSVGFKLYLRKKPQKLKRQYFTLEERGGINFEIPSF